MSVQSCCDKGWDSVYATNENKKLQFFNYRYMQVDYRDMHFVRKRAYISRNELK